MWWIFLFVVFLPNGYPLEPLDFYDILNAWTSLSIGKSSNLIRVQAYYEVAPVPEYVAAGIRIKLALNKKLSTFDIPTDSPFEAVGKICQEYDLLDLYCQKLRDHVQAQLQRQVRRNPLQVCIELTHTSKIVCAMTSQKGNSTLQMQQLEFELPPLSPGMHQVCTWIATAQSKQTIATSRSCTSHFVHCQRSHQLALIYPTKAQIIPLQGHFRVQVPTQTTRVCYQLAPERTPRCLASAALPYEFSQATTTTLSLWIQEYKECKLVISIEAKQGPYPTSKQSVLITAITERYFTQHRLQNLIGSIHYWEPDRQIHVVSLDLPAEVEKQIRRYRNVKCTSFPKSQYPTHVAEYATTYAFKPLVIDRMLELYTSVIWIDANVELRRPIDELEGLLQTQNYFFTIQGATFPIPFNNHQQTLTLLGCKNIPFYSKTACWSGVQGYTRGSWAHKIILGQMVTCALDQECFYPDGAQYPDQTVLNAVLCSLQVDICTKDSKWWRSSSLDDQVASLQPTVDETEWNEMVLYTRRQVPAKPYETYLQRA